MQNLLTGAQIRAVDTYTIQNQPIASIDLMEQAAKAFVWVFVEKFPVTAVPIWLVCGPGNNGGDGLAIARLLAEKGYTDIRLFLVKSERFLQTISKI